MNDKISEEFMQLAIQRAKRRYELEDLKDKKRLLIQYNNSFKKTTAKQYSKSMKMDQRI